ncbi:MAG: thioredoxin [Anaerolineaceae bacterium]|nr:thioredoxin [Anaerolineaceae bacterium]
MPVFDTPITTDSNNLSKILKQDLPVLLLLHEGQRDKPLEDALSKVARKQKGDLLVVKVDVRENPGIHKDYKNLATPAIISFDKKGKVQAEADYVRPNDVRSHAAFLSNGTPLPEAKPKAEPVASSNGNNGAKHSGPIQVSDNTWRNEVLKSKVPVLVDFWAPWCGPCRSIAPYVEQLSKDYAGRIKVVKLDTDRNQVMARRYDIRSIPTFAIFDKGQQVARMSGANPSGIKRMVEQALA